MYVALDVAPGPRLKWQTWKEGGTFPGIVTEVTSPSSQDEDLGTKVRLYGEPGARAYCTYGPAQPLEPPLRTYRRAGDRLARQPLQPGPDPAAYSPTLGTELRVAGQWLRLIDPATGQPIPVLKEDHEGRLVERQARLAAEVRAQREEAARLAEHPARLAAEECAAPAGATGGAAGRAGMTSGRAVSPVPPLPVGNGLSAASAG